MSKEEKSVFDELRNPWDYIAYGCGAAAGAAFEFHAGTQNYLKSMHEWGLAAIPLRRVGITFLPKTWDSKAKSLKADLTSKCTNAKELFSSDKRANAEDLSQELASLETAWKMNLLKDAKFEEGIERLVMQFLDRQKFTFSQAVPSLEKWPPVKL